MVPLPARGHSEFGGIENIGPILQKGDNFRNPQNPKEKLRYVTNYFNAAGKGKAPKVNYRASWSPSKQRRPIALRKRARSAADPPPRRRRASGFLGADVCQVASSSASWAAR